ncbi:kinetochore protein Nuf2 [Gastrophryne carolinensis]
MDKCTFPSFSAADLVGYIQQNILTSAEAKSFTKTDIYPKPKLEWVQKIFMRVLQQVFSIGIEQFYMVPVDLEIQYPHLVEGFAPLGYIVKLMYVFLPILGGIIILITHNAMLYFYVSTLSINYLSFNKKIPSCTPSAPGCSRSRVLPMVRLYNFHPSDVLNPKGKQTLYLFSGIVNFLQFREMRKEVYMSFCLSYKSALETMTQYQKSVQEYEAKKEKLTTIPPEQQAEFKALSSEIQNLQQMLSQEYRAKDMAFQENLSQKKVNFAEKNKKMNQLKLAIATMKEEQETMKSQIVESPEQRKNKTERMKENVLRVKQSKLETNERYEHYRERVALAIMWQPDIQAYSKKLHCFESSIEMCRKILEEIGQEEDQRGKDNLELKSVYTEEQHFNRTIQLKKEKLAKTDIKNQKKLVELEQRKKEIQEMCSRIQEKRQDMVGRESHVLQEIQQTNVRKEHILEIAEGEKKKYQDAVVNFRTALEKYHDNLQKTLDRSIERKREKLAELNRRLNKR